MTWGIGRTLYEFLNGCIFIFFKHAYDVGDRIEIYNTPATIRVSVVVTRISILFTVFRRIDNGKDLQMSNDKLNVKRIENISRSGLNREEVSVFVDFNTTFTDIQYLKSELSAFLSARENRRDYRPECELRVTSIYEMNKLELKCAFTHKSNWSNEELRAARSSKFMCALVAIIRKINIAKPGALVSGSELKEAKDASFEQQAEAAAYNELTMIPASVTDAEKEASGVEITEWIGHGSTGLRRRPEHLIGGVFSDH
jgi:small-conductance mechanosensitive channel